MTALLAIFAVCLWLTWCAPDGELAARIESEVARGPGTKFRLADLTEFEWERVHLFGPYTSPETIEKTLGFSWCGSVRTEIQWSESITLLVFVKGDSVVRHVVLRRGRGDFAGLSMKSGTVAFTPKESAFEIREGDHGWIYVVLDQPGAR
ncbi:MAG: hypothetical protein AAGD14_02055 [Planctomycetota bacterium]